MIQFKYKLILYVTEIFYYSPDIFPRYCEVRIFGSIYPINMNKK